MRIQLLLLFILLPLVGLFSQASDTFDVNLNVFGKGLFRSTTSETSSSVLVARPGVLESRWNDQVRSYLGFYSPQEDLGVLDVYDIQGDSKRLGTLGADVTHRTGALELNGRRSLNVWAGSTTGMAGDYYKDVGMIGVFDTSSTVKSYLGIDTREAGTAFMKGTNGFDNVVLGGTNGNENYGQIGFHNDVGTANMFVYAGINGGVVDLRSNSGFNRMLSLNFINPYEHAELATFAGNNSLMCTMGYSGSADYRGWFGIQDEANVSKAGMFIDTLGNGVVFGGVKSFVADHPEDDSKSIWHACIEGPEVALYDRGSAELNQGEVFIPYPEYLKLLGNVETVTIILTPYSADTYGLAVVEKNRDGFRVKELKGGQGNFSFDWEVKAKRIGYENFRVVREKDPSPGGGSHLLDLSKLKLEADGEIEQERIRVTPASGRN